MWKNEMSVLLSKGLIVLGLILTAGVCAYVPDYVGWLEEYYYKPFGHVQSCVIAYIVLAVIAVLLVFLFRLLINISRKIVFEEKNIKTLRFISMCCFADSAILFFWGFITGLEVLFLVAFTIGFMGLILRILMNVLVEAVNIKKESDYTI